MNASSTSRRTVSTIAAFSLAPLVAALGLVLSGSVNDEFPNPSIAVLLGWTIVCYVYAAMATVALGLPSFLLLSKLDAVSWWSATLVGIVVGIIVFVVVNPGGMSAVLSEARSIVWGGVGALSAFVFWVIWRLGHLGVTEHDA